MSTPVCVGWLGRDGRVWTYSTHVSDRSYYPTRNGVVVVIGSWFELDEFEIIRGDPGRETAVVEHCGGKRDSKKTIRDATAEQ